MFNTVQPLRRERFGVLTAVLLKTLSVPAGLYCFTLNLKAPRRYILARGQCNVPEILILRQWTSSHRSLQFERWCSVRAVWFAILRPQSPMGGGTDTARGFSLSAFCCIQLQAALACDSQTKGLVLARVITWLSLPKSSCMVDGGRYSAGCWRRGWHDISRNLFTCHRHRKTGSDIEIGKMTRGSVHC